MAEWMGIAQTTLKKFLRDVEDATMRNRKLLAKLKAGGAVEYNQSGESLQWRVKYRRSALQGMADGDVSTFARLNRHKKADLDWRGYASTDSVTKKERLMNAGREAIINRFATVAQELLEDIEENFGDELYIDGNASGNEKRLHGIESFMGTTGSAISGTCVMNPDDSYAGIDTDLGAYGGTWTGTWPTGKGSPEYDFYTPLILDATCTLAASSGGWASSTKTWAANAREILRYAAINTRKSKGKKGMIDTALLDSIYYRQFAENLDSKERITIERGTPNSLVALGFNDVINFEGMEVTYEFGMPASTAYGFNTNYVQLLSLQPQMFVPTGPDYDIAGDSYRFKIDFYGNLKFRSPKHFFKIANYGTSGA
jgi:hypothetical protein